MKRTWTLKSCIFVFKPLVCHLLTLQLWANCLSFHSLDFLMVKGRDRKHPSVMVRTYWNHSVNIYWVHPRSYSTLWGKSRDRTKGTEPRSTTEGCTVIITSRDSINIGAFASCCPPMPTTEQDFFLPAPPLLFIPMQLIYKDRSIPWSSR